MALVFLGEENAKTGYVVLSEEEQRHTKTGQKETLVYPRKESDGLIYSSPECYFSGLPADNTILDALSFRNPSFCIAQVSVWGTVDIPVDKTPFFATDRKYIWIKNLEKEIPLVFLTILTKYLIEKNPRHASRLVDSYDFYRQLILNGDFHVAPNRTPVEEYYWFIPSFLFSPDKFLWVWGNFCSYFSDKTVWRKRNEIKDMLNQVVLASLQKDLVLLNLNSLSGFVREDQVDTELRFLLKAA